MAESKPPEDEHQSEPPEQVEEEDPGTDVSGLPAVQQEALQELARQIVREAGLQRNPEAVRIREGIRAHLDTLKHTSTLAGAAVVAVLLLEGAWDVNDRLVAVTLGTVGVSFCLAVIDIFALTAWLELAKVKRRVGRRQEWIGQGGSDGSSRRREGGSRACGQYPRNLAKPGSDG
jgi:hypothetical protein